MRDGDVRKALYSRLHCEHRDETDTLLVDELALCGMARVDVAVVNGALSAYELKSARDNLGRLPTQVEWYSKVVDFATLVVAEGHLHRAAELLPAWWGVIGATGEEDVALEVVRSGTVNPRIDPHSLVRLLWRDEALAALVERGLADGVRSKPKSVLWTRLADGLEIDELRRVVRCSLKAREGWRGAPVRARDGAGSHTDATSRHCQ